ncbi:MAG: hypothetical protein [Caudoviricetes sp.]|nr:MAG: hypothetical protein [Caudoviricetes sp.]
MNNLPDVQFFDNDPQQIVTDVKNTYEYMLGKTVQESSPEFLFISVMAYWIVLQRQQYEAALKQNLLYYADDGNLDHLGAFRLTPRLEAQGASTTLEFTLVAAQTSAIIIPAGTRATADNVIYFATTQNLIINAGQLSGKVGATSIQTGAAANNIGIGEINTIVDPVAYVATVANTETTLGGRDTELDDAYRERIYNAPAVFSIAGPRDAYIYLAKSASSAIGEVTVTSDMAGTVNVYPLLTNGEVPNSAILDQVRNVLNQNTVRPLSDNVVVAAPELVTYSINLTYYILTDNAGNAGDIQTAVNAAIDGWILWQRQKIGRDINISELIKRIVEAGAKRVVMNLPINTVVLPNQLAVNTSKTITFGGLEDE